MQLRNLFFPLLLISSLANAQSDSLSNWKKSIESGLNVNQASFSSNWKGGGVSSIALGALLNAKANYETNKVTFVNDLQLLYGMLKNNGQSFRKTTDKIFFDSKIGYKLHPKTDVYMAVNFLSQFSAGYSYSTDSLGQERAKLISKFFAPAYLTSSLGLEYRPVTYVSLRFGVGSFRQTFVVDTTIHRNVPKNYGVPIGKKVRNEIAFMLTINVDKDIAKNINLKARYMAFANYETLKAIDNRLDVTLTAKVNKLVNVNLSGTILYDQDMDYHIQYAQALSLGVLIKYSEFKEK